MITLCGDPDWCIIFWQWESSKVIFKMPLLNHDPNTHEELNRVHFQLSLKHTTLNNTMNAVVTGPGVFQYYKVENDFSDAKLIHDHV
jgi:hypothetical protein